MTATATQWQMPSPTNPTLQQYRCADDEDRDMHGVDNGLDRGCVDVVVDDIEKIPARNNVPTLQHKQGQEINQTNNQNTSTATTTGTRSGNYNHNHKMSQATQLCQDARHCTIGQQGCDETIQ